MEMDQVKEAISDENMPMALGGKDRMQTVDEWVLTRLTNYEGLEFDM